MTPYDEKNSSPPAASENKPAAEQPSGYKGDNPSTAGPGHTGVTSNTPEGGAGHIRPSPENSDVTPGSVSDQ